MIRTVMQSGQGGAVPPPARPYFFKLPESSKYSGYMKLSFKEVTNTPESALIRQELVFTVRTLNSLQLSWLAVSGMQAGYWMDPEMSAFPWKYWVSAV